MNMRLGLWAKPAVTCTLLFVIPPLTPACSSVSSTERVERTESAIVSPPLNDVAISTRGSGLLDIFVVKNGLVAQRSFNGTGFSPWSTLPPTNWAHQFVGQPAAVSWDSTRIDVFAMDDEGNLEHNWSLFGGWNPTWESLVAWAVPASCFRDAIAPVVVPGASSYPAASGMAVTSWGPNRLDVFLPCDISHPPPSTGASLLTQITYASGWQNPRPILGTAPPFTYSNVSAVSWGPSRIDLVIKSPTADQVAHYWDDDGTPWNGPDNLGTAATLFCDATISSWGPSVLSVLQQGASASSGGGPDGSTNPLWLRAFRPFAWNPWVATSLPNVPPEHAPGCYNRPSSASWGSGRIDLVYPAYSADGLTSLVEHAWYSESGTVPGTWGGPEEL